MEKEKLDAGYTDFTDKSIQKYLKSVFISEISVRKDKIRLLRQPASSIKNFGGNPSGFWLGINLCRGNVGMTEQLLYVVQIGASRQFVGGKTMT